MSVMSTSVVCLVAMLFKSLRKSLPLFNEIERIILPVELISMHNLSSTNEDTIRVSMLSNWYLFFYFDLLNECTE